MNKHFIAPCFLFCTLFLVSCASTQKQSSQPVQDVLSQQKQEVSAIYHECLSEKHGEMLSCIQKKVGELENDVPVLTQPAPTASWKSSEEYARMSNPVPADQASVEKGKETYQFYCSACHGIDGRGQDSQIRFGRGIVDLTGLALKARADGELFWKITEGGWPMPAFWEGDTLSEQDIWMLINFLRTLGEKG